MIQKKYFVICVAAVYVILVVLFYKAGNKKSHFDFFGHCFDQPCVRFCCDDDKLCTENYINDNFNKSLIPDYEYWEWNSSQNLHTYFGKPECSGSINGLVEYDKEKIYKFYAV